MYSVHQSESKCHDATMMLGETAEHDDSVPAIDARDMDRPIRDRVRRMSGLLDAPACVHHRNGQWRPRDARPLIASSRPATQVRWLGTSVMAATSLITYRAWSCFAAVDHGHDGLSRPARQRRSQVARKLPCEAVAVGAPSSCVAACQAPTSRWFGAGSGAVRPPSARSRWYHVRPRGRPCWRACMTPHWLRARCPCWQSPTGPVSPPRGRPREVAERVPASAMSAAASDRKTAHRSRDHGR